MLSADSEEIEDDAALIALEHARHVGARQPHAGHHVDLEETAPVFVGNIEEPFRFENPGGIVDEDIDLRQRGGRASQPAAVETSAAMPRTLAPGTALATPAARRCRLWLACGR